MDGIWLQRESNLQCLAATLTAHFAISLAITKVLLHRGILILLHLCFLLLLNEQ